MWMCVSQQRHCTNRRTMSTAKLMFLNLFVRRVVVARLCIFEHLYHALHLMSYNMISLETASHYHVSNERTAIYY